MKKYLKYGLLSGPICSLCYFLHDVLGSLNYPGYSFMAQAVSDLTADSAPSLWIARPFSNLYGVFSVICVILVFVYSKDKVNKIIRCGLFVYLLMNLISMVGYTLFPLTEAGTPSGFQNRMHIIVTVLVVLSSIVSLVLISVGGLKDKDNKALGIISLTTLLCMMFGAIGSNILPKSIFGLVERFSTYSAVIFTGILGIYFLTKSLD